MAGSDRDAEFPVAWRGAVGGPDDRARRTDPADPVDPGVDHDELDAAIAAANARRRRRRQWFVVVGAIGFALASVVVTGVGGGSTDRAPDPAPATPASTTATTVSPTPDASSDASSGASSGRDGSPTAADVDVDADAAASTGSGDGASAGTRRDEPLVPAPRLARLPTSISDLLWTTPIGDGATTFADGARAVDVVSLAVGGELVVALVERLPAAWSLVALDADDGSVRWATDPETGRADLIGVTDELVGVAVPAGGGTDRVRWFDAADGSGVLADEAGAAAIDRSVAELAAKRDVGTELDPVVVAELPIEAADDASGPTTDVVERLADGAAPIAAAREVATGRLVLLVGDRLIGARTSDGSAFADRGADTALVADWSRPGVMLIATPSERGATLLVSDRRGTQQQVVDAATGRVVTELAALSSSINVYTPVGDGVVVKRPALVGSALAAIDLDGVERWRLVGSPPFAVGDRLVVTAALGPDGLVVSALR